jgi:hypothetical protein
LGSLITVLLWPFWRATRDPRVIPAVTVAGVAS